MTRMCGDTECPSCGLAQGTLDERDACITELEAERDALRAALIAVTKEPQGCRFCHAGRLITPNNPEKGHDAGCGFLLAARALLNKTADAAAIDS